ncbi:hypothetical protein RFI_09117 [Reticulomyxa filosa]|uniref:Mitochondrial carrier protein n=1 Tax=Reticulomyxa filosa TaxID=46433 RepID=X6NQ22_RETFI|nr:hypothetical protein RFI_09117 [Reticulomyxa filosa]|eukprot:ETO28018.1 hypothetical protein RFI_09117 [Reticulomyxa filosa]
MAVDAATLGVIGLICTVIFEFSIGHVLEILKIQKQATDRSYTEIYYYLTKNGLVRLWDGFMPWGLLIASCKGGAFSFGEAKAYEFLKSESVKAVFALSETQTKVIASSFGGLLQGMIWSPLLLLKTRVVTHDEFRNVKGGMFESMMASIKIGSEIYKKDGVFGLCKGIHIFSLKRVLDWATRYWFVEILFDLMSEYFVVENIRKNSEYVWICGLLGGTLSAIVTAFLDSLVSQIQDANAIDRSVSELFGLMIKDFSRAFRGIELRILHVALATVLMKDIVPWASQIFVFYLQMNYGAVDQKEL